MKNTARIAEHALHPMLIPFPIGMFMTSFVFDLMYLGTSNLLWYKVAYYMIISGIIGAGVAALPGLIDLFTTRMSDGAKAAAVTHGLLNVSILIVYLINAFVLRLDNGAVSGAALVWAVVLNGLALCLLSYSGWLGWELVYRYGIAIDVESAQREMEIARATPAAGTRVVGQAGGERPPEEEQPPSG